MKCVECGRCAKDGYGVAEQRRCVECHERTLGRIRHYKASPMFHLASRSWQNDIKKPSRKRGHGEAENRNEGGGPTTP